MPGSLPYFGSLYGTLGTATDSSAVVPVVPAVLVQPEPAETAWTRGVGGTVVAPALVAGCDLLLATTLRNNGRALAFDPGTVLAAEVTAGAESSVLFAPAATWIDAGAGTLVLFFAGNSTTTLDPGTYTLRLLVGTVLAYDGALRIDPASSGVVVGPAWATAADMQRLSTVIRSMKAAADLANFAAEIAEQTETLRRELTLRYDPLPGFVLVRQPVRDPQLGFDVPDPAAIPPTPAQYGQYLRAGGLILEQWVRDVVARRAITEILERQVTKSYGDEAAMMRDRARADLAAYELQIDTDGDGVADLLVAPAGTRVTLLPAGTAP